jgi:phage shock protein C
MYCTRCGFQLRETDRFCSQCAASVQAPHADSAAHVRLARLMYEKKIAGVCAGFARYFNCDVTLMRVFWLILAFGTGVGFIGYLIAWIIMPKEYSAICGCDEKLLCGSTPQVRRSA